MSVHDENDTPVHVKDTRGDFFVRALELLTIVCIDIPRLYCLTNPHVHLAEKTTSSTTTTFLTALCPKLLPHIAPLSLSRAQALRPRAPRSGRSAFDASVSNKRRSGGRSWTS